MTQEELEKAAHERGLALVPLKDLRYLSGTHIATEESTKARTFNYDNHAALTVRRAIMEQFMRLEYPVGKHPLPDDEVIYSATVVVIEPKEEK